MLSVKVIAIYDLLFTVTAFIKCLPFGWDNGRPVLKMYPLQGWGQAQALLNCVLDDAVTLGVLGAAVPFILVNYRDLSLLIPTLVFAGAVIFISELKWAVYLQQHDVITAMSQMHQTTGLINARHGVHQQEQAPDGVLEIGRAHV